MSRDDRGNEYRCADASYPVLTGHLLSVSVFPCKLRASEAGPQNFARFSSAGLVFKIGTSPDIDRSLKASVYELHAFIATGCIHQCMESSNSNPECHCGLVMVPSGTHGSSPIAHLLLHHVLSFARQSVRSGFFRFLSNLWMAGPWDPRLPRPYHSLEFFTSSNERTWNESAVHREQAFVYTHLGAARH
jgi:hypothetical protein